jgi:hypothetical protein
VTTTKPAAAPEGADEFHETECVYLGQRQLNDGSMTEAWIAKDVLDGLNDWDWWLRRASHFKVGGKRDARIPMLVIGGVYSMPVKMEGSTIGTARTSKREYLRQFEDPEAVARWRATDAVERARDKARRQLAKVKEEKPLQGELDLLRARYHKLPYQDRLGFQLMVWNYVTGKGA